MRVSIPFLTGYYAVGYDLILARNNRVYFQIFELAYNEVTIGLLREFIRPLNWKQTEWFLKLIDGFDREFSKWPDEPSLLQEYWRICDKEKRLTQVALCAFLHMTYDLARVIATNLRDSALINPNDLFPLFDEAEHSILRAIVKSVRTPLVSGTIWSVADRIGRLFAGNLLMHAFAFHIVMLRKLAWRWGKKMASSKNPELLEKELLLGLMEGTRKGLAGSSWAAPIKIDAVGEAIYMELLVVGANDGLEQVPVFRLFLID